MYRREGVQKESIQKEGVHECTGGRVYGREGAQECTEGGRGVQTEKDACMIWGTYPVGSTGSPHDR